MTDITVAFDEPEEMYSMVVQEREAEDEPVNQNGSIVMSGTVHLTRETTTIPVMARRLEK